MTVAVEPVPALRPLRVLERGEIRRRRARAVVANLPEGIARRELAVVKDQLGWPDEALEVVRIGDDGRGPGNVVLLEVESEHVTEVFTGFGEPGVRAETVAQAAVTEARAYLVAGVPVGPHLADQLLVPIALAGGGAFRTCALTRHATTNMEVIGEFLGVRFTVSPAGDGAVVVEAS